MDTPVLATLVRVSNNAVLLTPDVDAPAPGEGGDRATDCCIGVVGTDCQTGAEAELANPPEVTIAGCDDSADLEDDIDVDEITADLEDVMGVDGASVDVTVPILDDVIADLGVDDTTVDGLIPVRVAYMM